VGVHKFGLNKRNDLATVSRKRKRIALPCLLWTRYSFNSISYFDFGTEEVKVVSHLVIIFHSVSNPDDDFSLSENLKNTVVVIKTWIHFDRVFRSNEHP
jgi:hypothetical protein